MRRFDGTLANLYERECRCRGITGFADSGGILQCLCWSWSWLLSPQSSLGSIGGGYGGAVQAATLPVNGQQRAKTLPLLPTVRDVASLDGRGIGEAPGSRWVTEGDSGGAERIALDTSAGVRELQQPQGGGAAIVLVDLAEARIPVKSWRNCVCVMVLSFRDPVRCVAEPLQAV